MDLLLTILPTLGICLGLYSIIFYARYRMVYYYVMMILYQVQVAGMIDAALGIDPHWRTKALEQFLTLELYDKMCNQFWRSAESFFEGQSFMDIDESKLKEAAMDIQEVMLKEEAKGVKYAKNSGQ